jgi:uncharacterized protein with von Willebrand factor type A (vWA) domain
MGESKRRRDFERQSPERRLGDAPVEAEYHAKMEAVTRAVNEFFNGDTPVGARKVGFVLMVFPFGDTTGRCNYMSNGADRRDVVTLMKEMIARFEGQPETQGRA